MAQIIFDEKKVPLEDANKVIWAMQAYGHLGWSTDDRFITMARLADLIEKQYDCVTGDPHNREAVRLLRKYNQAVPVVLQNSYIEFSVAADTAYGNMMCLNAILHYDVASVKGASVIFALGCVDISNHNEIKKEWSKVLADASEQGFVVVTNHLDFEQMYADLYEDTELELQKDEEICNVCEEPLSDCKCWTCPECGGRHTGDDMTADPRNNQDDLVCCNCASNISEKLSQVGGGDSE